MSTKGRQYPLDIKESESFAPRVMVCREPGSKVFVDAKLYGRLFTAGEQLAPKEKKAGKADRKINVCKAG